MKAVAVLLALGIFFFCNVVEASLRINEILISPTSKQWIEIYNDGDSEVDLTGYKILDSGASVNGHGISAVNSINVVPPQGFAIVAKVPDDFSATSFLIFRSALGIRVSGDTVTLRDSSGTFPDDVVDFPADSAVGGNSFQLVSGSWVSSLPTPGEANQVSPPDPVDPDPNPPSGSGSTSTTSGGGGKKASASPAPKADITEAKTKLKIIAPKIVFIDIPFEFQSEVLSGADLKLKSGKYFWNFGDGSSKEISGGENFSYTYAYEGEYVVSLEYYRREASKVPDATAKITVKVVPMSVSISRVGNAQDFFVELSNNTSYDVDISGWNLSSANKNFVLPRNSTLLSKKKIILSPKVTNFSSADRNSLKLMTPKSELVASYGPSSIARTSSVTIPASSPIQAKNDDQSLAEESAPNLSALALSGSESRENLENPSFSPIIPLISFAFISASAGAVYFIRKQRISTNSADDFSLLDE